MDLRLPNVEYIPIFSESKEYDIKVITEEINKCYPVKEIVTDIPEDFKYLKNNDGTCSFDEASVKDRRLKAMEEIENIFSAYKNGDISWTHVDFLIDITMQLPPICVADESGAGIVPLLAYDPYEHEVYYVGSARVDEAL